MYDSLKFIQEAYDLNRNIDKSILYDIEKIEESIIDSDELVVITTKSKKYPEVINIPVSLMDLDKGYIDKKDIENSMTDDVIELELIEIDNNTGVYRIDFI